MPLLNGDRLVPDPIIVGRNEAKVEALARAHGIDRWDDGSGLRAGQSRRHAVLRRRLHQAASWPAQAGDRCRQACLLREADLGRLRGGASNRALCPRQGRQERHRPRQAGPAGVDQAEAVARLRLLRPHPLGARRVRLLGLRGRLDARATPELELPVRGWRRHHLGYAVPLALCARQRDRAGDVGVLLWRQPHSRPLGRGRRSLRSRRRRCRLCDLRAGGRHCRATEFKLVRAGAP